LDLKKPNITPNRGRQTTLDAKKYQCAPFLHRRGKLNFETSAPSAIFLTPVPIKPGNPSFHSFEPFLMHPPWQ